MHKLRQLYIDYRHEEPASMSQLPGAGSNRVYYRMQDSDGHSVIGVVGTSRDENHAFISLSRHFCLRQLPVPEVLAVSNDELRYLQTWVTHHSLMLFVEDVRLEEDTTNVR